MKITDSLFTEIQTDDGHIGTIIYENTCSNLERREGLIAILKNMNINNILHIGCCGHLENIKIQLESHLHFHQMLIENFDNVIGIDINSEAVSTLMSLGKMSNIFDLDILTDIDKIRKLIEVNFGEEEYIIILPEVLEHVPNPVEFLECIRINYLSNSSQIVISVPNAYGFGRVRDALFHNKECINMDHKYMFTPTTILKVMCMAHIKPTDIAFFDLYKYSKIFHKPILANTIVTVGKIN